MDLQGLNGILRTTGIKTANGRAQGTGPLVNSNQTHKQAYQHFCLNTLQPRPKGV